MQLRPQIGFTLLELMVTTAIISILAIVALPAYMDYITRSKIIEDFATVNLIKTQIVEYYTVNGSLPTKNKELGLPKDKDINGIRLEKVEIDKKPMPGTIKLHHDKIQLPRIGNDNSLQFVPTPMNGALVWDLFPPGSMITAAFFKEGKESCR